MRTIITIILISFLLTNTDGQKYFSFPDTGAIWSVNTSKISVAGDTLLKGMKYKKYFITQDDSVFSLNKASYYAALREDSSKRLWVIRKDSINEKLLYDFSLKLGDSAIVYPFGFSNFGLVSFPIKIAQVDSIQINLSYRKRYKISTIKDYTWIPEYWIEGIGSTLGVFNAGISITGIADMGYPELLCFYENESITYFGLSNNCFHPIWTNIKTNEIEKSICNFYPNPFTDISILHISGLDNFNFVLEIYNVDGSLTKRYQIIHNDYMIDRFGLSSGIYFYKLTDKLLIKDTGKIIIN